MKVSRKLTAILLGLIVNFSAGYASAMAVVPENLVQDGNFTESGLISGYSTKSVGTTFGGWTVGSGSIDLIGSYWDAPEEEWQSVDMNGSGARGSIYQNLVLTNGQQYMLSFYMAANFDQMPSDSRTLNVSVGGFSQNFTFNPVSGATHDDMGWAIYTAYFSASGSETTLRFTSLAPEGSWGPALTGVSITAVPIPGAAWLLGSGLIGLVGLGKRRRLQ